MTGRCPDLLELDLIRVLPETDSRRRHVAECPDCRGRLEALELFHEPGEAPELAGLASADAELAARLESSIRPAKRSTAPRARRFGLALAAVLALVAVGITTSEILQTGRLSPPSPGEFQRGPAARDAVVATTGPQGTEIAWPAAPDADEILYLFFADDMTEIGRRTAVGPLVLAPDDPMSGAAYCQAIAMATGDVIGRSPISRMFPDME